MEHIKLSYSRSNSHKLETDPAFAAIHRDPSYFVLLREQRKRHYYKMANFHLQHGVVAFDTSITTDKLQR